MARTTGLPTGRSIAGMCGRSLPRAHLHQRFSWAKARGLAVDWIRCSIRSLASSFSRCMSHERATCSRSSGVVGYRPGGGVKKSLAARWASTRALRVPFGGGLNVGGYRVAIEICTGSGETLSRCNDSRRRIAACFRAIDVGGGDGHGQHNPFPNLEHSRQLESSVGAKCSGGDGDLFRNVESGHEQRQFAGFFNDDDRFDHHDEHRHRQHGNDREVQSQRDIRFGDAQA